MMKVVRSSFGRDVMKVASGAGLGQLITILSAPFVARIYGPEAFGVYGLMVALVMPTGQVLSLGYHHALPIVDEEADSYALTRASTLIAALLALAMSLLALPLMPQVLSWSANPTQWWVLTLVPLCAFLTALGRLVDQSFIRQSRFASSALALVLQSVVSSAVWLIGGLWYPDPLMLATGFIAGWCTRLLMQLSVHRFTPAPTIRPSMWSRVLRHRRFALYRGPHLLLNELSQLAPMAILTAFFGSAAAGYYALVRRTLSLPATLVGKSIGDALMPRMRQALSAGLPLGPLQAKLTWTMVLIAIGPFAVVVIAGPGIYQLVFGAEWSVAGSYARWMALWLFVGFFNVPSVKALQFLGRQKDALLFESCYLLTRVSSLAAVVALGGGDIEAVAVSSLVGMILNGALIWYARSCVRNRDVTLMVGGVP